MSDTEGKILKHKGDNTMPYAKRAKGKGAMKGKKTKPIGLSDARKRVAGHMNISNAAYMRHEKAYTVPKATSKGKAQTVSGGTKGKMTY